MGWQRRRRGRSRLPPRGPGRQGDAEADQAAALCHGRGSRAHGPKPATPSSPSGPRAGGARRRETMRRRLRSWPLRRALDAPQRRPLAGDVMRLSDEPSPYEPQSTALEGRAPRGIRTGWLALLPECADGLALWSATILHAAATRARARPVGLERAPDPLPGLPPGKDVRARIGPGELGPRARGVAGARRRSD